MGKRKRSLSENDLDRISFSDQLAGMINRIEMMEYAVELIVASKTYGYRGVGSCYHKIGNFYRIIKQDEKAVDSYYKAAKFYAKACGCDEEIALTITELLVGIAEINVNLGRVKPAEDALVTHKTLSKHFGIEGRVVSDVQAVYLKLAGGNEIVDTGEDAHPPAIDFDQ